LFSDPWAPGRVTRSFPPCWLDSSSQPVIVLEAYIDHAGLIEIDKHASSPLRIDLRVGANQALRAAVHGGMRPVSRKSTDARFVRPIVRLASDEKLLRRVVDATRDRRGGHGMAADSDVTTEAWRTRFGLASGSGHRDPHFSRAQENPDN
jgi:hypothetical protein